MIEFYINYKIDNEQIIDLHTLEEAERGNNYFNPDDFIFLCEAETLEEAQQKHRNECFLTWCEKLHP